MPAGMLALLVLAGRALVKSSDYSSKIAYRILTHIIYIVGEIMDLTFAVEDSALRQGLLHY